MNGRAPIYTPQFAGGTVPNATTFLSTLTINKNAEAATAEVILSTKVTDDATAKLDIINTDASTGYYLPGILSVSKDTQRALTVIGQGTTDTGSNPLIALRGRIGASTAVSTRPIVEVQKADGSALLTGVPLNSGANLALSWGTQSIAAPAFTTRSAGTRLVLKSAIDGTHVDEAIGVETGGPYVSLQQATSSYQFSVYGGTTRIWYVAGNGLMQTSGAQLHKVRVATTTPVTVSAGTDYNVVTKLAAPGAVAVNLPAGITGLEYIIQDGTGDAAANNITITPAAGTINGAATLVINANYGAKTLFYTGTEWLAR